MIVLFEKPIYDLKIGLVGSRKQMLIDIFDVRKIPYVALESFEEVDQTLDVVFGTGLFRLINEELLCTPKHGMIFFMKHPFRHCQLKRRYVTDKRVDAPRSRLFHWN